MFKTLWIQVTLHRFALKLLGSERYLTGKLGGYEHVIDKFGASWFRRHKRLAIAGTPIPQRPDEPQCPSLETPINKREPALRNAY